MMRVFIDDVEVGVVNEGFRLPLYRFSALRGVEGWREGSEVVLEVRSMNGSGDMFGMSEELHRKSIFNDSYHSARIEVGGVVIFSGVATLLGVKRRGGEVIYRVRVRVGGAEWADNAANTRLSDTAIDLELWMYPRDIRNTWSTPVAVRMLPLHRDSYVQEAETGIQVPQQTLLPHNYHPFISVSAIIDSIANEAGYQICSNFLSSSFAKKLMISGAYKRVEVSEAYASMGFKALRTRTNTAQASIIGRVNASMPVGGSNIGNVVDTVNPNTLDENGNLSIGAYDNGGCFTFENNLPIFRPKREISVAFDVNLHYTTEYRIVSSSRLCGFDTLYFGDECYVDVGLPNHFANRSNEIVPGAGYKLFIFDFDPTKSYYLTGVGDISAAVTEISFEPGFRGVAKLYVSNSAGDIRLPYTGDWAIYDSYVEERGTREVKITVRTSFSSLSPTSPKRFNELFFSGAEEGMKLTLHAGCSITPIFGGVAGYGEKVTFKDIANHDISQAQLLEAIAHLFNLCIYTHRPSKRIYIEPYDDFFAGGEVDWRDRELDGEVTIEECVADSFLVTRYGYQPSDGATKRLMDGDSIFGEWNLMGDSFAVKQSVASRLNPLFLATASMRGAIGVAPSAALLAVGNRDIVDDQEYVAPRVALYHGLKPLTGKEYWPMVNSIKQYPLVAFHSPECGETLCFEDRDGCSGLHRFYDNEMQEVAQRQRVTMDIYLPPAEYISLFDPNSSGATIRSRFRLKVGGNSSLFRLDEILAYDGERGVARCRFQRLRCD